MELAISGVAGGELETAEVQLLRRIGRAIRQREFSGTRRRLTRIYHALAVAMGFSEWAELCRAHPALVSERMERLRGSSRSLPASVGHISRHLRLDIATSVALLREVVEPIIAAFEIARGAGAGSRGHGAGSERQVAEAVPCRAMPAGLRR